MRALLFVTGLALTVAGVAMLRLEVGLILAGLELAGVAWFHERAIAAKKAADERAEQEKREGLL